MRADVRCHHDYSQRACFSPRKLPGKNPVGSDDNFHCVLANCIPLRRRAERPAIRNSTPDLRVAAVPRRKAVKSATRPLAGTRASEQQQHDEMVSRRTVTARCGRCPLLSYRDAGQNSARPAAKRRRVRGITSEAAVCPACAQQGKHPLPVHRPTESRRRPGVATDNGDGVSLS